MLRVLYLNKLDSQYVLKLNTKVSNQIHHEL
jgi:hypothetical protein